MPNPKSFVEEALRTIDSSKFLHRTDGGDVSQGTYWWLAPASLTLGGLTVTFMAYHVVKLIFYKGRSRMGVDTRPNLTVGVFRNKRICTVDAVLQFLFPLILPVGELCLDESGKAPSTETLARIRAKANTVSAMTYNTTIEALDYEKETVALRNCTVLLHTRKVDEDTHIPTAQKPPLVVWAHGGGLTIGSAVDATLADFMKLVARNLHGPQGRGGEMPAWASVEYRMAPEHKFPAAIDDFVDAVLHFHEENALSDSYSSIHLAGTSAGAYLLFTALERLSRCHPNISISSVFAQEPMMPLTGDYPSEFVNAYTRTCLPRWIKWAWGSFAPGGEDVYCGMTESSWWSGYAAESRPPRFIVTLAKGDPMFGAAHALVDAMEAAEGMKLDVFVAESSHACSVLDYSVHEKMVEKLVDNLYNPTENSEERASDESFDEDSD